MSKLPTIAEVLSQPIVEELSGAFDPFEACQRLSSMPHLLFLDSAANDDALGRFSFVTADPVFWLITRGNQMSFWSSNTDCGSLGIDFGNPLDLLETFLTHRLDKI